MKKYTVIFFALLAVSFSAGCLSLVDKRMRVQNEEQTAIIVSPPFSGPLLKAKETAESVAASMYGTHFEFASVMEGKSLYFFKCGVTAQMNDARCPYGCMIAIRKSNAKLYKFLCYSVIFIDSSGSQ